MFVAHMNKMTQLEDYIEDVLSANKTLKQDVDEAEEHLHYFREKLDKDSRYLNEEFKKVDQVDDELKLKLKSQSLELDTLVKQSHSMQNDLEARVEFVEEEKKNIHQTLDELESEFE